MKNLKIWLSKKVLIVIFLKSIVRKINQKFQYRRRDENQMQTDKLINWYWNYQIVKWKLTLNTATRLEPTSN